MMSVSARRSHMHTRSFRIAFDVAETGNDDARGITYGKPVGGIVGTMSSSCVTRTLCFSFDLSHCSFPWMRCAH